MMAYTWEEWKHKEMEGNIEKIIIESIGSTIIIIENIEIIIIIITIILIESIGSITKVKMIMVIITITIIIIIKMRLKSDTIIEMFR